jgi:O-antigen/teichoic acid export membrane protein
MEDLGGSGTVALADRPGIAPRSPVATGIVAKCAELATLVALVAVVPRVLGPADFGGFALALSLVTIASAAVSVGASPMLARFVPAADASERKDVARTLGAALARRRAISTGLAVGAAATLATFFPETFPPLATALVALAFVLDVAATLCFQLALGLGRYRVWSFRYPVQNGVLTVAAVALASVWGETGALAAIAVSSGSALVLGAVTGALPLRGGGKTRVAAPAGAVQFGRHQAIGAFLLLLAHRGGVVVVAIFAGARETGYAGLASGVGLAALYAVHQIFLLQLAALSEHADEDPSAAAQQARRLAAQALALFGTAAIAGAIALDDGLPAVFGEDFADARTAFIPVLVLLPFIPLATLGSQLASLQLRPQAFARASAAGLAAFLVTAPTVAAVWGAPGAPVSLLATTLAFLASLSLSLRELAERRLYVGAAVCSLTALAIALAA